MQRDLIKSVLGILAILAVTWGLAAARPQTPPKPLMAPGGGSERVVMRVNGEPITEREFNAFLLQAPEQMQFFYATPEGRRLLANEVAKLKALEQEGRRMGVHRDPEVAMRVDLNQTNIIAGTALRRIVGSPTEERIRAEYAKESQNLGARELSHILVTYAGAAAHPRSGKAPSDAEAMRKARQLRDRIRRGESFEEVARKESDDLDSAPNGGSLGPLPPGSMPPELEAAVANLKPGEVSEPVRSEFGIHIFKVGEARPQPYEAVRDALAARIQRAEAEAAMERLEKAARVDLDPKFFPPERKKGT